MLEGDWLEKAMGVPCDVQELVSNLGRTSVFPQLSLKPYCTSRQALPGAEAMRALVGEVIRKKLGRYRGLIATLRGVGYRFQET